MHRKPWVKWVHFWNKENKFLVPEPDNQYDSNVQRKVDSKWHKIGYIVREVLDDVHRVLVQKNIVSIKFAWAKYVFGGMDALWT